jgi:uncharacterized protein
LSGCKISTEAQEKDFTMTYASTAQVPTSNSSRYLQQLCKHWGHKLAVEFTPEVGSVVFAKDARGANWPDDARLELHAQPTLLECTLKASSAEHLEQLKGVVQQHLDRFAFREAPLSFDWRNP